MDGEEEKMIAVIILVIIMYGILKRVNVFDTFTKGAEKGFTVVVKILPTLVGLMVGVAILRTSGFLDFLSIVIGNVTSHIGFPGELVPLAIVRMFSSSAATGLVLDIFKEYGTDSRLGYIASIMMSCTESVFYTMSVYFMVVKIKKTRYTLAGALLSTLAGIIASVWIVEFL